VRPDRNLRPCLVIYGFEISGLGFGVEDSGSRILGSGVQDFGFRNWRCGNVPGVVKEMRFGIRPGVILEMRERNLSSSSAPLTRFEPCCFRVEASALRLRFLL